MQLRATRITSGGTGIERVLRRIAVALGLLTLGDDALTLDDQNITFED